MTTLTATRAASTVPAFRSVGSGLLCAAYGSYDLSANPTAADVIEMCRVPAGAVILGGFLRGEDLDSNGSPTLDIDVGTSADTDAFGNFGALNGTAVTNYLPEGGFVIPLHGTLKDGPVSTTAETVIQCIVNTAAATFAGRHADGRCPLRLPVT
jgi:hypothetical protein